MSVYFSCQIVFPNNVTPTSGRCEVSSIGRVRPEQIDTRSSQWRTDKTRADHEVTILDLKNRLVHSSKQETAQKNSYHTQVLSDIQNDSCADDGLAESEKFSVSVRGPITSLSSTRTLTL